MTAASFGVKYSPIGCGTSVWYSQPSFPLLFVASFIHSAHIYPAATMGPARARDMRQPPALPLQSSQARTNEALAGAWGCVRGCGGPKQPTQLGDHGRLLVEVAFKKFFIFSLIFRGKVIIAACG